MIRAVVGAALIGLLFIFSCCAAIKSGVADGTYTGQILKCVERAETLSESQACRHTVDAKWYPDGGADE